MGLGQLVDDIIADIADEGGIITAEDLTSYRVEELEASYIDVMNYRIYLAPPPSSGVIFAFILNIMAIYIERGQLNITESNDYYHKLIEACKVLYKHGLEWYQFCRTVYL